MLAAAGIAAAIVPDLPLDESGPWCDAADAAGIETVMLAAPTAPDCAPAADLRAGAGLHLLGRSARRHGRAGDARVHRHRTRRAAEGDHRRAGARRCRACPTPSRRSRPSQGRRRRRAGRVRDAPADRGRCGGPGRGGGVRGGGQGRARRGRCRMSDWISRIAECELCEEARITPWFYEDEDCWIAECEQCAVPMVVWRRHDPNPSGGGPGRADRRGWLMSSPTHYGFEFYVDDNMRSIPDPLPRSRAAARWVLRSRPCVVG